MDSCEDVIIAVGSTFFQRRNEGITKTGPHPEFSLGGGGCIFQNSNVVVISRFHWLISAEGEFI
jgi:hypothetical protein